MSEADRSVAQSVKPTGSARRKLWQLSLNATCPVVGVCLRLPELVRLAKKADIDTDLSEYNLHITVVSERKKRTRLAEEVQRELESRFSLVVGNARRIRTTEDLDAWCHQELTGAHLVGALWAALTHAKCTPELEYKLLGHVYMLQHHVGMVVRADHSLLEALALRNSRLNVELQGVRDRMAAAQSVASTRRRNSGVTSGMTPNQCAKAGRAWFSNMPRPSTTTLPRARAAASSGVSSGT